MDTTQHSFSQTTLKQFKSVLSNIDRKKFRVDKVETTDSTSWIAVRLRRIGLYRTSIVEGTPIVVGRRIQDSYEVLEDLSILNLS